MCQTSNNSRYQRTRESLDVHRSQTFHSGVIVHCDGNTECAGDAAGQYAFCDAEGGLGLCGHKWSTGLHFKSSFRIRARHTPQESHFGVVNTGRNLIKKAKGCRIEKQKLSKYESEETNTAWERNLYE